MSDTEVKRRMSEDSGSSSDQENGPTQNFREDGEPLNRPRKDSSSSSSDEEGQDDHVDDSSSSCAISKSVSQDQTSTSESARVISKEEKEQDSDSSDTDEDVSKKEIDDEEDDEVSSPVPIPAARKVSAPSDELTKEEVELSKRETVALKDLSDSEEEVEEEKAEVSQVQVNVEEVSDNEVSEEAAIETVKTEDVMSFVEDEPSPVVEHQQTSEPEIKRPQFRHSASSSSDEEIIPDQQTSHIKGSSPSGERALDERKEQLFAAVSPVPPPASQSPVPSRANASNLTKIYTDSLEQNNNINNNDDKTARAKPSKDITSIYTQAIAKSYTPPSSPKPVPSRNKDITQLYTGQGKENGQQQSGLSPCIAADKLNPKKHNMSTAVDKDAIRRAYEDVRSDGSDTQWAVFKFDGNNLKFSGSGADFKDFKASFSNEDRGFGYIRINTGDEMSKRAKFVFVTWVGPSVSVMKKAKMSTDKALMKDIIQNMSVELQFENHSEFSHDHFKSQVDKAAGARYGTGERAL